MPSIMWDNIKENKFYSVKGNKREEPLPLLTKYNIWDAHLQNVNSNYGQIMDNNNFVSFRYHSDQLWSHGDSS